VALARLFLAVDNSRLKPWPTIKWIITTAARYFAVASDAHTGI
jgi:hypothetical protein